MRVKHWQGYGSVDVKKITRAEQPNNRVYLHLQVRGLHECGICREDKYDVVRWIGTRCDKALTDYRQITDMRVEEEWDEVNREDICDYYISYIKNPA